MSGIRHLDVSTTTYSDSIIGNDQHLNHVACHVQGQIGILCGPNLGNSGRSISQIQHRQGYLQHCFHEVLMNSNCMSLKLALLLALVGVFVTAGCFSLARHTISCSLVYMFKNFQ